jgi:hypothetical protein
MRKHSRKTLRLAISRCRQVLNRSDLDPRQKAKATKFFTSFIQAALRQDARRAGEALNDFLRMLLRDA